MPYDITVRTNQDPREIFKTFFKQGFEDSYVLIKPSSVAYGSDGLRMRAQVNTGSNVADAQDINLIQRQLYTAMMGLPMTPKNAVFIIDVVPVADKIKYWKAGSQ